jgi:hypothetical protein
MEWDASIDLVQAHLEAPSADPSQAVEAVRFAVQSLPGAGLGKRGLERAMPAVRWLRVCRPGSSVEQEGAEWDTLKRRIESIVSRALA